MSRFWLFLLFFSATSANARDEVSQQLWANVAPQQSVYHSNGLKTIQLNFAIVNDGAKPVNPKVEGSVLTINGKPYAGSLMMFGNGPRSASWNALQPGDSLQFTLEFSTTPLLQNPGVYRLQWKGHGFNSPVVQLHVLP